MSNAPATLCGWGRSLSQPTTLLRPPDSAALAGAIATAPSVIARGAGRAYGDAALNPDRVIDATARAAIAAFDAGRGLITADAGLSLAELIGHVLPQGWFPPVIPGTAQVTLGGMVAADVHGKNHHQAGSLVGWLRGLRLALADGSIRDLTPGDPLLAATAGGMGLTGVIETVTLQLIRIPGARIRQQVLRASGLDAVMDAFDASQDWPYSVAWIDCLAGGAALGRSILYRGEHAEGPPGRARTRPSIPFDAPAALLNRTSLRAFNAAYYHATRTGASETSLDSFFFPLDAIGGWNRLYGRRGFHQHQSVIPLAAARPALRAMLSRTRAAGLGSFLAVLKLFGHASPGAGPLSFPMRGYTLALDFPNTPRALALMNELDRIVLDHGGRLYLAKDSRAASQMLRHYDIAAFAAIRNAIDPEQRFTSLLSTRLGL